MTHKPPPAYDEPTQATAIDGEVVLIGPDALAVAITPDAAEKSAEALIRAAREARLQAAAPNRER